MRTVWNIPDLRSLLLGQFVGLIGAGLNLVAMVWLAWELTGTVLASGIVMTGLALPAVLLSVPAGKLDRHISPIKLLRFTQIWITVTLAGLTALMLNHPPVWSLYIISTLIGVLVAVSRPCRVAMIADFADGHTDDAMRANSLTFNVAGLTGPAVGGLLLTIAGGAWVSGIATALWVIQLVLIRNVADHGTVPAPENGTYTRLRDVLRDNSELCYVVILVGLTCSLPVVQPLPLVGIIGDTFARDAAWYGTMASLIGLGSVIGALGMKRAIGELTTRTVTGSAAVVAVLGILMGLTPWFWALPVLCVLTGIGMVCFYTSAMSVITKLSGVNKTQVIGLYYVLTSGFPIKLLVGWCADEFGARSPLLILGTLTFVGIVLTHFSNRTASVLCHRVQLR